MKQTSTQPFRELAASLRETGFAEQAKRLEDTLDGVWTTSSELISELGVVVLDIRRQGTSLSREQKHLLKECLRQVRGVWPGFGLWRSLWPWT